jgi:hypothetical protein
MNSMQSKLMIGSALLALGLTSASAITTVAGVNFQDNAFADSVISSTGSYNLVGAPNLQAAVTGSSLTKFALSQVVGSASIQAGFTDNYLVNGAGYDLALFEFGSQSTFSLTVLGTTINYLTSATGFTTVFSGTTVSINVAMIDLTDFGAAANAQFSSILIGMGVGPSVPSLSVVGAMNSAPKIQSVPDAGFTAALLGAAFLGLGLIKRKF